MRKHMLRFPFVISCAAIAFTAHAEERIHEFNSEIVVFENGGMVVSETIRVNAEGGDIKRGIYRDFPTQYRDDDGNIVRVGFEVLHVKRDGVDEPFHTESKGNGVRVYIGQSDYFLPRGEYTYTLTYRTTGQLGFFGTHDELYWNVTGNGWIFPIDRATATVQLPAGIDASDMTVEAYTGPQGAKGADYMANVIGPSEAFFETTKRLGAREGLTIVVTFPKGIASELQYQNSIHVTPTTRAGEYAMAAGTVIILLYFLFVWALVGRDPAPGRILPRETPPDGYSPAALRYVERMGADSKAFSVALVNMAVKGYVAIDQHGDDYTVKRTEGGAELLTVEESAILETLFSRRDTVHLKKTNHEVIGGAKRAFEAALKDRMGNEYFRRNGGYFTLGYLLAAVVAIVGFTGRSGAFGEPVNTWLFWVCLATLLVIVATFYILLRRPTLKGRALLDQMSGFKMYLNGDGTSRFSAHASAEELGRRFEKYLPFAIALDAAAPWADEFQRALSASSIAQTGPPYRPLWYHGDNWSPGAVPVLATSLDRTFSGAVASSATPPGSSSGSGGGGSSGGGGGGGGGGGW